MQTLLRLSLGKRASANVCRATHDHRRTQAQFRARARRHLRLVRRGGGGGQTGAAPRWVHNCGSIDAREEATLVRGAGECRAKQVAGKCCKRRGQARARWARCGSSAVIQALKKVRGESELSIKDPSESNSDQLHDL
eukprot:1311417-Pleurochrysis_carterae.AAC.1